MVLTKKYKQHMKFAFKHSSIVHVLEHEPLRKGYQMENYGGPQLSHQNQMLTANYKSLTTNSNRSQQIQIAHSKFKSLTANYKSLMHSKLQIAHSKWKSPTANSNRSQPITNHSGQITNRSQDIQIAHSKFKSLTANYKSLTANYKSPTANSNRSQQIEVAHSKSQIINSARRLRLSTASDATRLKIFVIHRSYMVIHEAATL